MTAALTSATRPDTVLQSASPTEFKSQGVYVRDDWKVTPQDRVTLGYRSQHYSAVSAGTSSWATSGSTSASELQYSRHFNASLVGYVRAGQNFRLPNVDDNSSVNWDDNGQPILLVPQVSHDVDIGVNYRSTQWLSELKLFNSNIKHEIAFDPSANWNYGGNVNYDPTRREGVSIRQAYRFSPVWDVKMNLHHVKASFAKGQYAGNIVPNTARNYGNVSLGN
jgi:iron complex outermembrane receptor protein